MQAKKKVCCECRKLIPLHEFIVDKRKSTGRGGICRPCNRIRARAWLLKNIDKVRARSLRYTRDKRARNMLNPPVVPRFKRCPKCAKRKKKSLFHPSRTTSDGLGSYCKSCHYLVSDRWRKKHPDGGRKRSLAYYYRHQQERRAKNKTWIAANRPKRREQQKRWIKHRLATDPACLWKKRIRTKIYLELRGYRKSAPTEKLIGCTFAELRKHLESLFQPGMSWANYGRKGWVIDHKRPLASFDLSDPAQQRICCHYTNLQPLWYLDNAIKGDRLDWKPNDKTH